MFWLTINLCATIFLAARAAQRDQIDLAAAVGAGVGDAALRDADVGQVAQILEHTVVEDQHAGGELLAAEGALADIQIAAHAAGLSVQPHRGLGGGRDAHELAFEVCHVGLDSIEHKVDGRAAAEQLHITVGIHDADGIAARGVVSLDRARYRAVAREEERHGLAGLELAQALLRRGQDLELRAAEHLDAHGRAGRGIAALVVNRHAGVAGVNGVAHRVIGHNVVLTQGGNGAEHAVAVNGVVGPAVRQGADAARGLIRRENDRRVADRRTGGAAGLGHKGHDLAVAVRQQIALEAVERGGAAGTHQRLWVFLAGNTELIAVHGDERDLLVALRAAGGRVALAVLARAEHVDKQLRRLRAGDVRAAGEVHAGAHAGGLGEVDVAVGPDAAAVLIREAEHAHEDGDRLSVGDVAVRLERAVRQTREQLRLALPHGKVDIARRPVRRAHIGEDGHGLVAHGVAALAHEHDHHLAEFRASEQTARVELPRAVALDHAEQPQDLHILRRLLVRHIGEALRRRGGDRRCRECQHKREQQGKYSLFHVLSPLIPPAALRPAGAWMP